MPVITATIVITPIMVAIPIPLATLTGRAVAIGPTAITLLHVAAIRLGLCWRTHGHGTSQGEAQAACNGGDRAAQFFHDLFPFEKRDGVGLAHYRCA